MRTATQVHEAIESAAQIAPHETRVIDAIEVGEAIRQGDVYLVRISRRPKGWDKTITNRQLAPGTTQGSRHVLAAGPVIYGKPEGADVLLGPVVKSDERFELCHPEHAHFSMPAGTYQVRYQQDYAEQERRAVRD